MPNIDWDSPIEPNNVLDASFYKFSKDLKFRQLINFSTKGSNILDVLLANRPELFAEINKLPPFGQNGCFSDHNPFEFKFYFRSATPKIKYLKDFSKANYVLINSYISRID